MENKIYTLEEVQTLINIWAEKAVTTEEITEYPYIGLNLEDYDDSITLGELRHILHLHQK